MQIDEVNRRVWESAALIVERKALVIVNQSGIVWAEDRGVVYRQTNWIPHFNPSIVRTGIP